MTLSDKYKQKAIELGLCKEWTDAWKDNSSKAEMLQKFVRGNDFCIKHDFPSVEDLKEDAGELINEYGVYCDQKVLIDNKNFIMLCGKCDADIYVDGIMCDIYIRHDSEAKIHVQGAGKAFIRMYDRSYADIDTYKYSKAYVYDYCGATVKIDGNVVMRDRKNISKN